MVDTMAFNAKEAVKSVQISRREHDEKNRKDIAIVSK